MPKPTHKNDLMILLCDDFDIHFQEINDGGP